MTDVLDMDIGLVIGILNEKVNQYSDLNKKEKKQDEEVMQGTAEMLMKM